jgi:putative membrane protein
MAFLVPLLIGPAYVGMGYLSWTLARLLIRDIVNTTLRVVAVPLVASFLMVAWDLTMDPLAATVSGHWIWHDGGSFFGVPFSNFLGWYFTVYVIFQLFALYLHRVTPSLSTKPVRPAPSLWWSAVAMYGITAAQPLLRFWFQPTHAETVTDPSGTIWNVADIYANGALMTLFAMGMIVVMSVVALTRPRFDQR